jgi:hypothetical protein
VQLHRDEAWEQLALADPLIRGKNTSLGSRAVDDGSELGLERLRCAGVIRVGDHDVVHTADLREMRLIVHAHREWVNQDVALLPYPANAVEVHVSRLVEGGPGVKIGPVEGLHSKG